MFFRDGSLNPFLAVIALFMPSAESTPRHGIKTTNIGSTSHPLPFHYLSGSSLDSFGLLYTSPRPPGCLRPLKPKTVELILSTAIYTFSSLPTHAFSKPYRSIGPDSNERLAALDTRLIVRQYRATNLTAATNPEGHYEYPAAPMKNGEVLAASILAHEIFIRDKQDRWNETAFLMCYVTKEYSRVDRCTGMIMLQKDLYIV